MLCPRPVYIAARTLDAEVLRWLEAEVADPINAKAEVLHRQKTNRGSLRGEVKRLAREVNRIDAALTRLTRQVAEGLVPPVVYAQTRDELMRDRAAAAQGLQDVQDELIASAAPAPRIALSLVREWPTLDALGRREVLASLLREIRVRPRGVEGPRAVFYPWWEPAPGSVLEGGGSG